MSESSGTMSAEDKRRELEAELERLAEEERQVERERLAQQQLELEANMDPAAREQKAEIERRAREQLDREFPPAWSPQKQGSKDPDEVIGLVLNINPRVGPSATFGTYSAVVELRTTAGVEWTIWCNESGALYSQLTRLRVQPGEVIGIRYRGKKESQTNPGQSYHDFKLVRIADEDEPSALVDYDALERGRTAAELGAGEDDVVAGSATSTSTSAPPEPVDDIPF